MNNFKREKPKMGNSKGHLIYTKFNTREIFQYGRKELMIDLNSRRN